MVALYEQMVSEILSSRPNLSAEDVSSYIIDSIEKDILPQVIREIKLPALPSPIEVKRSELRKYRYGKEYENATGQSVVFVQDLEKLRYLFNYQDQTNERLSFPSMDDTQQRFIPRFRKIIDLDEQGLPVEPDFKRRLKLSTSTIESERISKKSSPLIVFDPSVEKKVFNDLLYEKLIA